MPSGRQGFPSPPERSDDEDSPQPPRRPERSTRGQGAHRLSTRRTPSHRGRRGPPVKLRGASSAGRPSRGRRCPLCRARRPLAAVTTAVLASRGSSVSSPCHRLCELSLTVRKSLSHRSCFYSIISISVDQWAFTLVCSLTVYLSLLYFLAQIVLIILISSFISINSF